MAASWSFLPSYLTPQLVSTFMRGGKQVSRTRNEKGQFVRGDFEKLNIYAIIKQLMDIGRDIMKRAYRYTGYIDDRGNLMDSTACAVYVNGELVDDSIVYANPYPESIAPSKEKRQSYAFNAGMSGREAIDEWFNNNKQIHNKKNTIQLVVIAAMHYGYYLEKGTYGAKGKSYAKIEVISGIADELWPQIKSIISDADYRPSLTGISGYSELI